MADQTEVSRMQFAQSLNAVADALRNCAHIAENYAAAVRHSGIGLLPETAGGKRKAQALEDGTGKKKRKPRVPKDPNAPKRPASSYLLFQNDIRAELKKKHPGTSHSDLLSMISKQWQQMTEDEKAVYNEATAHAKEKYVAEKAAYDARDPKDPAFAAKAAAAATPAKKATKATKSPPKSAPEIESSSESSSENEVKGTQDSSEEDSEEDSEEEEEVVQHVQKKAKKAVPPPVVTAKDKKQKKV